MWTTNIKIAIRNFLKDKTFSFLNLLGLSVGMAACLVIGQFVRYEYQYDRNSPFAENIWRVYNETISQTNETTFDANTHSAIGPALKADLPEVVEYTRLYNRNEDEVIFLRENTPIKISGTWMTDPGFLRMFPQQFMEGNAEDCLTAPYNLVLTASSAQAIFGKTDVVGQTVQVPVGEFEGVYTVKGVVADPMPNTHLKFNVLASYATRYAKGHEDNWSGYWEYNYFQTLPGTDPEKLQAKLTAYSNEHLREEGLHLRLQAFTDIHLHSNLTYEIEPNGHARSVHFLAIVALLILLIAFFNYVNSMTAKAMTRAKEVGLRKVVGASRQQLIVQFIMEGMLLNGLALLFAVAALPALLHWFSTYIDRPLQQLLSWDNTMIISLLGIFTASVVVSCLYPAVALSGYRPVQVLKGHFVRSKEGQPLRSGLVVFQFACSITLIIAVIVVVRQLSFLKNHDLGLSLDQVVAIKAPELDYRRDSTSFTRFSAFQNEAARLPGVRSLAMSDAAPGLGISTISGGSSSLRRVNDPTASTQAAIYMLNVSPDFFTTYDIGFLSGGTYEVNSREAIFNNIILNESALRLFGFPDAAAAIGESIAYERNPDHHITVRGVVADFHIEGLQEPTRPTLYYLNPRETNGYLSLKMDATQLPETLAALRETWSELFPLVPFESWFVDEHFAQQYAAEQNLSKVFGLFAGLAVFIACLGLFGLATFTAAQRTKEVGIRKVLGASAIGLVGLLSKDFLKLVLIALVIASPLAYFFMDKWLQGFAYRMTISWWVFLLAGFVAIGIAFLTVGFQSVKAALANPVESLRSE